MILLDGKKLSHILAAEIADQVTGFIDQGWRPPHLGAVLIGDNPASRAYVGNKIKLCDKVGFKSTLIQHPSDISEQELLDIIQKLNEKTDLDGYIVQLPLPRHIDETKVLLAIDPKKDVDGFHPLNIGKMTLGLPGFKPATPYGILLMIEHYGIETTGKHIVVLGRSQIVGTPISILLSRKGYPGDATVTLAHSKTKKLQEILVQADIIIAALGIPNFVKADMVKEGAIVIDVGINKVDDPTSTRGYRLVGDVDFEGVANQVEAITPVPGGVGPMTVMALIVNTLSAYRKTMKVD
jgi:methylenetetrahydrofolate dehydrogenase (NADP+)/methenyltetrahydrofolate cyclohydrolase